MKKQSAAGCISNATSISIHLQLANIEKIVWVIGASDIWSTLICYYCINLTSKYNGIIYVSTNEG